MTCACRPSLLSFLEKKVCRKELEGMRKQILLRRYPLFQEGFGRREGLLRYDVGSSCE